MCRGGPLVVSFVDVDYAVLDQHSQVLQIALICGYVCRKCQIWYKEYHTVSISETKIQVLLLILCNHTHLTMILYMGGVVISIT